MHQTAAVAIGVNCLEASSSWSRRRIGLLVFGAALLALSGCANVSVRLYDANLDKQGVAAKADWEAVKPTATLAAAETNNAALLKSELAHQDAVAVSVRNLHLRSFIDSPLHNVLQDSTCDGLQDLVNNLLYLDLLGAGSQTPGPDGMCGFPSMLPKGATVSTANWKAAQDAFFANLDGRMQRRSRAIGSNLQFNSKLSGFDAYYAALHLNGSASCRDVAATTGYSPRLMAAFDAATPDMRLKVEHFIDKDMRALCHDPRVALLDESEIVATYAMAPRAPLVAGGPPSTVLGGAIKEAYDGYKAAKQEFADAEEAEAAAEAAFKAASDAYDKAVAAAVPDKDASSKLNQAAVNFQKVIRDLEKASAATGGRSDVFISKQRLDALATADDSLIKGLAQDTVPAGTSKPVAALVLLSGFDKETQKVIASTKGPLALPLQLYRDQQQLINDQSKIVVGLQQAKVKLAEKLLQTVTDEIHALYSANVYLQQATLRLFPSESTRSGAVSAVPAKRAAALKATEAPLTLASGTFLELFGSPDKNSRLLLEDGALTYMDVVGRLEAARRKIYYQQIDADYALSLSYSAANVKRWQALITSSVDQIAGFAASGIRPDFWATLVETASLIWIGHGVNK